MDFFFADIAGNPQPPDGAGGFVVAHDGLPLRYALFRSSARPRLGTIIQLPGRNEAIEKYFETIADFQRLGYDVAILDWRGQGFSGRVLSDRRRGHVQSFSDFADDLRTFIDEVVLPDCHAPYHVIGHSMGGLAALLAAPAIGNQIERIVLSAPLLGFHKAPLSDRRLGQVSRTITAIGLGGRYLTGATEKPADFAANSLTSDRRRFERNNAIRRAAPELALGGPTIGWIAAACAAIETVRDPDFIARIHVPVLIVAAGADTVVSNRAIEDFARRPRAATLLTIDGARHELMQEDDVYREPFLAAADAFMSGERRAGGTQPARSASAAS